MLHLVSGGSRGGSMGSIDPPFELSLASLVVLCCFRFYFLFYENSCSCSVIPCMNSEALENLYYSVDRHIY